MLDEESTGEILEAMAECDRGGRAPPVAPARP
jgi:hypothetical protein